MARPTRRRGNLPAEATSFVGRRRELAELRKKLATVRLVTLVGPGGVGKTRLAIRIGTDLSRAFPDGAWLVELADVRDPGLVGNAVLAALDLRDQAATEPRALLLSHLRERKLLLLVDNCEHLLEAAALLVADVLRAAPGVRVVATSREPLSITGRARHPDPAAGAAPRAGRRDPRPASPQRVGRALHRAGRGGLGPVRADHLQPDGGRGRLPAARRSAARDRARGGQDAGPVRGADRRSPGGPVRPAHGRQSRGPAAPPDPADRHRVEPRPAEAGGAGALPAPVRLRRPVHPRRRRIGVRVRRRAAGDRPGRAVIAGRQVAGAEGRRPGHRVLSTARVDARVRRPQDARGGRGGSRRAPLHRPLRLGRSKERGAGPVPARRVARMDGRRDRQHPLGPPAMRAARGCRAGHRSRRRRRLVLDHAFDDGRRALAGRAPRDGAGRRGVARRRPLHARVPRPAAGRPGHGPAAPRAGG